MGDPGIRDTYDQMSAFYDAQRVSGFFLSNLRLLERLVPEPGARCLEIGCGTGAYVAALREAGYDAHGVDFSERMCQVARAKLGDGARAAELVRCADVEETLGFEEPFRTIYVMDCWECFPHPEKVAANAHRLLEPGGRLLIFTPTSWWSPVIGALEALGIKKLKPAFTYHNSSRARTLRAAGGGFRYERQVLSYYTLERTFVFTRV